MGNMKPSDGHPQFELVGPLCEVPGCSGILVDTMSLKTKEIWKQCSECKAEFYRMSGADALGAATRVIQRVLKGEKVS